MKRGYINIDKKPGENEEEPQEKEEERIQEESQRPQAEDDEVFLPTDFNLQDENETIPQPPKMEKYGKLKLNVKGMKEKAMRSVKDELWIYFFYIKLICFYI